jgi:uncharacterized protein (TIGR03437 family)
MGASGDGGPASEAQVFAYDLAADSAGNVFFPDFLNNRVRQISPDGLIRTAVGGGTLLGAAGSGGPATGVQLILPERVVVDAGGNLFVSEGATNTGGVAVRKVSEGVITTVAGGGSAFPGDGGPATLAFLNEPYGLGVDGAGNLLIADSYRVRKVAAAGIITTVAGNGAAVPFLRGDGGPALAANFGNPQGVALDRAGNLFVADTGLNRIRKISADGIVSTVAGNGTADLNTPCGVAVDGAANIFIADCGNSRIRKVAPDGTIATVAGNGRRGSSGDGGPSTNAQLNLFQDDGTYGGGVAVDGAGNLFIADMFNNRVRKVAPDGTITTVAGNGTYGFSGDGASAIAAQLKWPAAVAADGAGNLFIGVAGAVRKVDPSGIITTIVGVGNDCCFAGSDDGDGGLAMRAHLSFPTGLAVDESGDLFIADAGWEFVVGNVDGPCCHNRIRKVSLDGAISSVSGDGTNGFSGDGGAAITAVLNEPSSVAVDRAGNLYVADTDNLVVRVLRPAPASVLIGAVVDAASERADAVSPGKIVVLYGAGMGPSQLVQNQPLNGLYGTAVAGTTVSFSGISAPILYASSTQVAAVVPYGVTGTQAYVTVSYQGQASAVFTIPLVQSAPSFFTLNQTGAGQVAAINTVDGTVNTAVNPVRIGEYISLWVTGEGQTSPAGVDGKVGGSTPPHPVQPWSATVNGIPALVQYAGGAPGLVAGLMQLNVQIPSGVQPGGYVSVVLQVGSTSTTAGAVWIAVSRN